jgi:nitronate monooxygenase
LIQTRVTELFGLDLPIVSAPMATAGGGRLAAAVSRAGGLGLIGGGYGDPDWIAREFDRAGDAAVGCGLITWALADRPRILDQVLERGPRALLLSFGDPAPYASRIARAGVALIVQVQTLRDAKRAADCGADVIVAQGAEAGGHGETRGLVTLVPEIRDWLGDNAGHVVLLAAGGIADGRGLAAALMLGAEGAMVGTRLWASREALVPDTMHAAAIAATGDETIRTRAPDVARGLAWPRRYAARVLGNAFTDRWHDDPDGLAVAARVEGPRWRTAFELGDTQLSNTFVGEATGLIDGIRPAGDLVSEMAAEAAALLGGGWALRR